MYYDMGDSESYSETYLDAENSFVFHVQVQV